jgi:hypothetical protein
VPADHIASLILIAVLVAVFALAIRVIVVARRRADLGYRPLGEVVVRCRDGHLFTTIWVPLMSFKAIRLGWIRLQYCPVGEHWTFVTPVPDSNLTNRERRVADRYHDGPIP